MESLPFQILLGAILPVRVQNLLPACENIGTTPRHPCFTEAAFRFSKLSGGPRRSSGLEITSRFHSEPSARENLCTLLPELQQI
jgi:hypothetical protein